MRLFIATIFFLHILGCASIEKDGVYDAEADYEELVREWEENLQTEPPSEWAAGKVWAFIYVNDQSEIVRRIQVKITEKPVRACVSGDWRELKVLQENPKRTPTFEGTEEYAAYSLEGSNMLIMLRANICDSSYVRGAFSEEGYEGKDIRSDPFCGDNCMKGPPEFFHVFGVPIET